LRIVSGKYKGRRLAGPAAGTRPTSDRLRESLFNILTHRIDVAFENARTLDLFAGTGALGLEALSRGAPYALFVEQSSAACKIIDQNVSQLNLNDHCQIFRGDATRLKLSLNEQPFDLVFCDPPYGRGLGYAALKHAGALNLLRSGSIAVLEEERLAHPAELDRFQLLQRKDVAASSLFFYSCI